MQKELRRSAADCKLFGVCGGLAEYLGIDSNLIRLIWVAVSLFAGTGVLLYFIAAIIMPKADVQEKDLKDVIHPKEDAKERDLKDVIHPKEESEG